MRLATLTEISDRDRRFVGGKALSLACLRQAGFSVPDGLVVTVDAGEESEKTGGKRALSGKFITALRKLGALRFAVRSSGVDEDSETASWAGQLETFLNVPLDETWEAVQRCRSSLGGARATSYAKTRNLDTIANKVAVLVQPMIASESAGVVFTAHPVTGTRERLIVEATFGLGSAVVDGRVTPDRWIVDRGSMTIVESQIGQKTTMVVAADSGTLDAPVDVGRSKQPALTEAQVLRLAALAIEIETLFKRPQDIEWGLVNDKFEILQSRPITAGLDTSDQHSADEQVERRAPILTGLGASRGIASGPVRIVATPEELQTVQRGDVVVSATMAPELVDALAKASAVITLNGGLTSHAAVVAREFGIPCVVGISNALELLKDLDTVTVDGGRGHIFRGIEEVMPQETPRQRFPLLVSTGDDCEDFLASFTRAASDTGDMWPLTPSQMFPYFQISQALDMRERLKAVYAKGVSAEEAAPYFVGPKRVRNFMVDIALMGMKCARRTGRDVTIEDQVEIFRTFVRLLRALSPEDPFCLSGRNFIMRPKQAETWKSAREWRPATPELRQTLAQLTVSLFNYVWSLYFDYFSGAGMEAHGPYQANSFGPDTYYVVKNYYDLSPQVWRERALPRFGTICLAQAYQGAVPVFNFGSRVINQDELTAHATQFHLSVDGEGMWDVEGIKALAARLQEATKQQVAAVNALSLIEKVRKSAELSYYSLRDFYAYAGTDWLTEATQVVNESLGMFGSRFVQQAADKDPGQAFKRNLFDPRSATAPI